MSAVPLLREYPKRPTRSTILSTTTNESTEVFERQHQPQETETSTKQLRPEKLDLETDSYNHHHITSFPGDAVASLTKVTAEETSSPRREPNEIMMLQMDKELNSTSREDLRQHNLFRRFHHHHHHHQDNSTNPDGKNKRSEEGEDDAFHTSHHQTIVAPGTEGDLEDDVIDLDVVHPSQPSRVTLNFIGCRKGSKHKKLPTHHHQTAARKQASDVLSYPLSLGKCCRDQEERTFLIFIPTLFCPLFFVKYFFP